MLRLDCVWDHVAVRKLNVLRPQIFALGNSRFSTSPEPSSKPNPPVRQRLFSWRLRLFNRKSVLLSSNAREASNFGC